MMYIRKSDKVQAVQFNYIDGIDGKKTHELAKRLGLSQNVPASAICEIETRDGWKSVYDEYWIITTVSGYKEVCNSDRFKELFEPVT